MVNDALASLDGQFAPLYVYFGRPSIAPERLIRASLIQILFSVRSERQLMEQMQYNLMFRWFVGLGIDDPVCVPTVFTKNRDRLLTTDMSRKVMAAILAHREVAPLLSDEHFSVDGTLIKAWASMKSFQPKAGVTPPDNEGPDDPPTSTIAPDNQPIQSESETEPMPRPNHRNRNAEVDFKGEKRSNATHLSTTDPEARLARHRRDTVLHGPCADGEPARSGCSGRLDAGRRLCRATCRPGYGASPLSRINPAADAWGGQGV